MKLTFWLIVLLLEVTGASAQFIPDLPISDTSKVLIHGCWDGGNPLYYRAASILDENWYYEEVNSIFIGYKSVARNGKLGFYHLKRGLYFYPIIEEFYHEDCAYQYNRPIVKIEGKYGVLNVDSSGLIYVSVQPVYDRLKSLEYRWPVVWHNTTCACRPAIDNEFFIAWRQDKVGVVSYEGEILVPIENDRVIMTNKFLIVSNQNFKWAIDIRTGKTTDKFDNLVISGFNHHGSGYGNEFLIATKDGLQGALDSELNFIVPLKYHKVRGRCGGTDYPEGKDKFFVLTKGSKQGLTDSCGKMLLPVMYDEVNPFEISASRKGRKGPVGYASTQIWSKTCIGLSVNDRDGLANRFGDVLFEPIYDWVNPTYGGSSDTFVQVLKNDSIVEFKINRDYTVFKED
ncbi:MAG: hypothetical protein JKY54_14040 [Flavobacteriales bacterium]|nr:hypothetical protein [Flavobacteriales bacterium]